MDDVAARFSLKDVRIWAQAKMAGGTSSPWDCYQLMKLIEAADAILAEMDAARKAEASPPASSGRESHLHVVETPQPQAQADRQQEGKSSHTVLILPL